MDAHMHTHTLAEQMFQMAPLLLKDNNCAKLFCNLCINVEVMAWTNPDGCTHAHTYTEVTQTAMSHLPQAGSTKAFASSP